MVRLRRRRNPAATVTAGVVMGGVAVAAWVFQPPGMKVHEGATAGQLLVSADGRTLTLSIGWSCERQPDLVVRETADTVKVSIRHTVAPGFCDLGGYGRITAQLKAPLGGRSLTDATTGRPVVHFDGRNLVRPTYLPDNYYPTPAYRMVQLPSAAPVPAGTPDWTTGYQVGTEPGAGSSLVIRQALGASTPPADRATTVNGRPATFTDPNPSHGPRSLTWSDGTYTFSVTSSGPTPLPDQELIRVAQGLK
ncbi:hypothetical protein [Kitasatospora sp. NPDC087314]|uniref:hypothetical protein n=1 Tax=Kitasatospora sp. NPDC087314 TaxID=3364068 RepID=UPI0038131561